MITDCVLDTYPWLHFVEGTGNIPRKALRVMDGARGLLVPALCMWEVAMLLNRDRIAFRDPRLSCERWLRAALATPCELAPLTPAIAATAADLEREGFHGDPADRIVYATARELDAPLITGDAKIHEFESNLPRRTRRLAVWD